MPVGYLISQMYAPPFSGRRRASEHTKSLCNACGVRVGTFPVDSANKDNSSRLSAWGARLFRQFFNPFMPPCNAFHNASGNDSDGFHNPNLLSPRNIAKDDLGKCLILLGKTK